MARQGTWMLICTTISGVFMFGVHLFAPYFGAASYGLFLALLALIHFSMIPAPGLQTIFAREAASMQNESDCRLLAGNTIGVLMALTLLWAGMIVGFWGAQDWILTRLKMEESHVLWMTFAAILPHLWLPVIFGILQGREHFGYLGSAILSNGFCRFAMLASLIFLFERSAKWAITAPLFGVLIALALGCFACRDLFRFGWETPNWRQWLQRAFLIALGPGIVQMMLAADMLAARVHFDKTTCGYYGAAAMLGRGMVMFASPIAGVMFPKLVRETSHKKGARLLKNTMFATLGMLLLAMIFSGIGAYYLPSILEWAQDANWISQSLQSEIEANQKRLSELGKIAWNFLLAMGPLALVNVFMNHLVAKEAFGKIALLAMIPIVYVFGLCVFSFSVLTLILWIGIGNASLLIGSYVLSRGILQSSKK